MTLGQELLTELKQEAAVTRKYLERVPFDKTDYKPHEKSEALGRLAIHVAEIVAWWKECLRHDKLDFMGFEPKDITSTEQLLSYFDDLLAEAIQVLFEAKDEDFEKEWSMTYGEEVFFFIA